MIFYADSEAYLYGCSCAHLEYNHLTGLGGGVRMDACNETAKYLVLERRGHDYYFTGRACCEFCRTHFDVQEFIDAF